MPTIHKTEKSIPAATPPVRPERRRWRTLRAVLIGTIAVATIAALAPYNDYLLANTFMIGSFLPLAVVLGLFVLVVIVNAPLSRFAPRWALSPKEIVIILGMMLVACAIPTQGMMRYWLPMLVAPFYLGQSDAEFWRIFSQMELPGWFFPVKDIAGGRTDPIVTSFYSRVIDDPIPYDAWIAPMLGWGVFIAAWMASLVAMALLIVPQWATNERLPFPLAQLQAAVIEPPQPRRWFNDLFASRAFWIGLLVVYAIHNINALQAHFPTQVPAIPLRYDFNDIFTEPPWQYFTGYVKAATIYFTYIGVAYFIQSRVAFSLWAIFLLTEIYQVQLRVFETELTTQARFDQHGGASVAFAIGILWIGRHHWVRVLRHLVIGPRADERRSYRLPAMVFVAATAVMIGWFCFVKMQPWVAVAMVMLILLAHLVVTRLVAETGLPFFRFTGEAQQLFANVPASMVGPRDALIAGMTVQPLGPMGTRESLLTFATHAYRVEQEVSPERPRWRLMTTAMGWALAVAFVVCVWASLRMYYTYATPLTADVTPMINPEGIEAKPRSEVVTPVKRVDGGFPQPAHSPAAHFTAGLVITGILQVLALRYSSWPFMPVGYVAAYTWYMQLAWYSLMIGWLAKVLILRFGGATMFMRFRPFFIGIIFGEALAAATWLIVNGLLAAGGYTYFPVRVLPA